MLSLEQSYDYCRQLTGRTAHNFRFSFLTLPAEKRRAMNALYAFNRVTDDLGDDPTISLDLRRTQLKAWRQSVLSALSLTETGSGAKIPGTAEMATLDDHPALPAVADVVARFHIPQEYLLAVIDGVEMDLHPLEIATFADLEQYCYRVAGAVGLCCIHIWGFHDQRAKSIAIDCGLALQLTNILRDLGEDASLGRTYLPKEDFVRFGYRDSEPWPNVMDDRFRSLMEFEVQRTKTYYERAEELFPCLHADGQPILRAMLDIYGGLLREIERRHYDVFSRRVSLPKWKKLWFAGRAILLHKCGFRQ